MLSSSGCSLGEAEGVEKYEVEMQLPISDLSPAFFGSPPMYLTSLDIHRELCKISSREMGGRNHLPWLYLAALVLFAALGMEHSQAGNSGVQCGFLGW